VTHWIDRLEAGDRAAAQPLWERYIDRLVRLAGQRLRGAPRAATAPEDVARSAFDSFCRGAARGRYPQLADRHDLWALLVRITERKATDRARREGRPGRDHTVAAGDSTLSGWADASGAANPLAPAGQSEPTSEFAAQVAEEYQLLMERLGDGELQRIAVWKMEGDTNAEIAAKLDCAVPAVERRLRLIRKTWEREVA
jgi:DNA-directed RNA polymerase specialized sigma24 family protein